MSELNDRFEGLANRGTRRGVDAVLGDAMNDARAAERGDGNGAGVIGAFGDLAVVASDPIDEPPVVMMEEVAARRTRRPWRTAVSAGGLAALLGVTTMGIASLLAGGGADSPEGAVRQLADAIEHEDPLAAVDVLVPDEVRSLRNTVDRITRRAEQLELVSDVAAPLAGIDLSVADLGLRTEELAPGYAKVTITGGEVDATIERSSLTHLMQRALGDDAPGENALRLSELTADGVEPFVVTIQHDGGWYISPAYTALEYVRILNDLPVADYGSGVAASALGADSPQAAARDALTAYSHGDWNRLWELAPPNELPLYDYRVALTEGLADTESPNFTVDSFDATADVDGDTATITVHAAGTTEDGGNWSIDDGCLSIDQTDYYGDNSNEVVPYLTCPSSDVFPSVLIGLGGYVERPDDAYLRFTAVRRGERWFLSPVGTALDVVDYIVANADERAIYTLFGMYEALPVEDSITLGEPVRGTAAGGYRAYVYTFEGRGGQEIVGAFTQDTPNDESFGLGTLAELYGPDGENLDTSYGMFYGEEFALPADGTYRLVLLPYFRGDYEFSVYDAQHAPAYVLDPPGECTTDPAEYCADHGAQNCALLEDGSAECTTPLSDTSESASCGTASDGSAACHVEPAAPLDHPPDGITPTTAVEVGSSESGSASSGP
ncbi:MAG: hypothetical protein ACT4OX_10150 [Actinomycetota bacterium]